MCESKHRARKALNNIMVAMHIVLPFKNQIVLWNYGIQKDKRFRKRGFMYLERAGDFVNKHLK